MRRELIDKQEERFGVSILLLGKLFFVGKFEGVRNLLSSHSGVNRIFIAANSLGVRPVRRAKAVLNALAD